MADCGFDLDRHLERAFFARETRQVARDLLGQIAVCQSPEGRCAGMIVETEAYLGADDPASHAATLRPKRIAEMWREVGIAYIYRSYGIHVMLNVVAQLPGETGAVLIRALQPLEGIALMQTRRGLTDERALCSGPGKLCQALGIRLDMQGLDLTSSDVLWLAPGTAVGAMCMSGRIGISKAKEEPWRYWLSGNPNVSAHRRGEPLVVG